MSVPHVLFDHYLLAWPDQLPADDDPLDPLARAACLLRRNQHRHAEALLLDQLADAHASEQHNRCFAASALLAHQCVVREHLDTCFQQRVKAALALDVSASPIGRYLQAQLLLACGNVEALQALPVSFWQSDEDGAQLLQLARAAYLIRVGQGSAAEALLTQPSLEGSLESIRLRARLFTAQRRYQEAAALLLPAAKRAPTHLSLQVHTVKALLEARDGNNIMPALRHASAAHGDHPRLLGAVTAVKLLQRQPGMARRAALLERASLSVFPLDCYVSNLLIGYEHTGHTDWMPYLTPSIRQAPASEFDLGSNLILQLASCESPQLANQTQAFLTSLQQLPGYQEIAAASSLPISPTASRSTSKLRVAWFTPDLANHPVGRFLHGFFSAAAGSLQHQHTLVSTLDNGAHSWLPRFEALADLEVVNIAPISPAHRIGPARDLQADIAIDLSGWTANHFMPGFLARIAPLQITYLGYFATTGLPTMDVWLGDQHLFPDPVVEWHTEQIHRLARCFIAWQPSPGLPEAKAQVSEASSGPIRFGSFNHLRKISDDTLRLWGTLLNGLPEAQLVLKAHAQDDAATQELLRRRLHRAGIDPQAILWLPFAATPEEHLQQYRHIDIALDPFPNGGCTTTCEALWMGVPTVALAGRHYVSRMSTAVLHGAGLGEWVASTPQAYVDLARERAASLQQLRRTRGDWRTQLQASPLGDAADLMQHLEQAFSQLYAQNVSTQAASG